MKHAVYTNDNVTLELPEVPSGYFWAIEDYGSETYGFLALIEETFVGGRRIREKLYEMVLSHLNQYAIEEKAEWIYGLKFDVSLHTRREIAVEARLDLRKLAGIYKQVQAA